MLVHCVAVLRACVLRVLPAPVFVVVTETQCACVSLVESYGLCSWALSVHLLPLACVLLLTSLWPLPL